MSSYWNWNSQGYLKSFKSITWHITNWFEEKDIIVHLFEETILLSNQTKIERWTRFCNLVRNLIFLLLIALKFLIVKVWGHHQLSNFWLLHNYADEKQDEKLLHWLNTCDTNVGDDIYYFVSNNILWKSLYFSCVQILK